MRLADLLSEQARFLDPKGGCGVCPRKLKGFAHATLRPTKMILVGDAPAGFDGKAGQWLKDALHEVGIELTDFSLTYTVHCQPPGGEVPEEKEIACCLNQYVLEEVKRYSLVVLLGNVAINAFFPGHVQQVKGHLAYHPDFPNSRFFSMVHPASISSSEKATEEFLRQVARLGRIFKGDTEAPFSVVTGADFRSRWAGFLLQTSFLSLDLEMDRLESWDPSGVIKSLAACDIAGNEVFSLENADPFWETALDLLVQFLQNPENQVLGQNIGFDLVWLEAKRRFKCDLKYIHDIQVLYYQLQGRRYTALKPLVSEQLDGYRHLVVWPHLEKDDYRLKMYNAEDVHYPVKLFLRDFHKLRPKTQALCKTVLGPSSLAISRIRHAGIYFRSQAWEALNAEFLQARETAIKAWEASDPDFIRASYITDKGFKNLDYYMYEVKKYPIINLTEKEQKPSTDDATIKELVRQGAKQLQHCLDIKSIDKRMSTYIKSYPKLVAMDRRIHASYNNTTTSSGRLSSSSPNMQNNPRKEAKWKNQIRWLFGAPDGCKLCEGDFSQIELRIAMSLANDPTGMEVYRLGGDIHLKTAEAMQAAGAVGTIKELRQKAKPVNFGLLYGQSPEGLQQYAANQYGIQLSDRESYDFSNAFFATYSTLRDWHTASRQKLRENKGYVESATGHYWYYSDWDSKDPGARAHEERSALNSECQGPAAQMMTYLIYRVQQAFWKKGVKNPYLGHAEVVLTVHDSLAWEPADEYLEQSLEIVNEELKEVEKWSSSWFKVPLVLDVKTMQVWGE